MKTALAGRFQGGGYQSAGLNYSFSSPHKQRDDKKNQTNAENDIGKIHRRSGYPGKAENTRDNGDDECPNTP